MRTKIMLFPGLFLMICVFTTQILFAQEYLQLNIPEENEFLSPVAESGSIHNSDDDTLIVNGILYYKKGLGLKSPEIAFLLALFPGTLFRGSGHFYAGKKREAAILFGLSIAGMGGWWWSASAGLGSEESAIIPFIMSAALFFGTWGLDLIMAPTICYKENRRIIKDLSFSPFFKRDEFDHSRLGLQLTLQF